MKIIKSLIIATLITAAACILSLPILLIAIDWEVNPIFAVVWVLFFTAFFISLAKMYNW